MAIVRPKDTLDGHVELDMRVSPLVGQELRDEIIASVARQQMFIKPTLPDRLVITQKQFASLNAWTEAMYETSDRMFRTPLNVMEVVIDREVDIVEDIEQIIRDVEILTQLEDEKNIIEVSDKQGRPT